MPPNTGGHPRRLWSRLGPGLPRLAFLTLLWWVLSGGAAAAWAVGVPTIAAAYLLSLALSKPVVRRWRLPGLFRFLSYFAIHSVRGGVDVAWRALHPSMPLHPGIVHYRWRLPAGPERIFLANIVSLLPGSLSAELDSRSLTLHVLDSRLPFATALRELEARVADAFGLPLPAQEGGRD